MNSQDKKITMYTEVINMAEKKNDVITFRTEEKIAKMIDEIGKDKEWSRSKVVEKICQEYYLNWINERGEK